MPALRVATYNVRHCQGMDGRIDVERIAGVLRGLDCHLVALQEIDVRTRRCGGTDQAAELAARTGMTVGFSPSMAYDGGFYGNAILSNLPVRAWHMLALPGSEPRSLLAADVVWRNHLVRFISTHLDLDEHQRLASMKPLRSFLTAGGAKATILAGDFNAGPEATVLRQCRNLLPDSAPRSLEFTYPAPEPDIRIDHLLFGPQGTWEILRETVVAEKIASDHRPVVAEVRCLPEASPNP